MQVFKAFFIVLKKKKASLLMYISIYMVLTLILSSVLEDRGEEDFSNVSLSVAVDNQDRGSLGEALTEYLGRRHNLQGMPKGKEALQDAMYFQRIDYVLAIPEDFTEKMESGAKEGLLEGTVVPGSSSAHFMENEIGQYLQAASLYLAAGYGVEEIAGKVSKALEQEPAVGYLEEEAKETLPSGYYFFQYIPYVFLVLMILGVGAVVKTFKEKDLSARNQCSAMPFLRQNIQLLLGCMVYILAVYALFILAACLIDKAFLFSLKGALSAANAFLFALCALSVAWFSVQLVQNVAELNIMSNIFGLGFSFLGGVFVPMEFMGDAARKIAKFVPSYWYVAANEEIQKAKSLAGALPVYQSFFMVLAFSAAFFAAGLLVSRMKVRA
ncbi:MAG: ABC transporter permease [Lachnospiraceae bacterium]|jgi:ABC-2 type transport system permease protein|nr:ABC transporter permease [Lachnospiraceae bacterium]